MLELRKSSQQICSKRLEKNVRYELMDQDSTPQNLGRQGCRKPKLDTNETDVGSRPLWVMPRTLFGNHFPERSCQSVEFE